MDSLEFQDWEVLTHPDLDAVSSLVLTDNPRHLEEIEADSSGMISDRSDGRKASDLGLKSDQFTGADETEAKDVAFDRVKDEFSSCQRKTDQVAGFQENKTNYCSDEVVSGNDSEEDNSSVDEAAVEEVKKQVVWWKVPLELLKFCVFRVSPVWTFSMAAAVMGFLVLGRRLYNMKRKAKTLQLKVTVDDKKVSQFMSRAARLNEAFSVARRIPIVRPMLPPAGVNSWPVMNMRW